MATKYIAPANHATTPGSNAADGSNATPWLTFTYALSQMAAGDTLKVKAGTYTGEQVLVEIAGTSAGNPFVIEADDPNNKPTLDGEYLYPPDTDPTDDWTSNDGVRGLHTPLVRIRTNHCTWRNINVYRSLGRGLLVNGSTSDWVEHVLVEGCEVHQIRTLGLGQQEARYVTIRNCNIHHTCNYIATPLDHAGNWSPALKCNNADHITFEYNMVWHTFGEGIIISYSTEDCISRFNIIFNCKRDKMYVMRSKRAQVYGNLIYDTQMPYVSQPKPSDGLVVRNEERTATATNAIDDVIFHNNIIIGCSSGMRFGGTQGGGDDYITNVRVYHNIFVNAYASDGSQRALNVNTQGFYSGCEFKNNLVYQPDFKYCNLSASKTGVTISDNGFDGASGDVPSPLQHAGNHYSIGLINPDIAIGEHLVSIENYRPETTYAGITISEVTIDFENELRASHFMGALTSESNAPPPVSSGLTRVGVSYVTVGTSAGDVDHTDSTGMAGETPIAALVLSSHATSAGSVAQFGRFNIGAVATSQFAMTIRMRDAVASASNRSSGATDALVLLRHNSTTAFIHEETFSQFIANGVRGTRNLAPSVDAGTIMALFGGTAFQSASGVVTCASSNGGTVTIALPWTPSIVFFFAHGGAYDRGDATTIKASYGVATSDTAQFSMNYFVGGTMNTDVASRISNANIGYDITNTQTHTITTWAQNLVITTGGSTGTRYYGYLALKVTGASVYAGTFTTPTGTGNQTYSAPNFKPAIAGTFLSLLTALNSTGTDATAGSQMASVFTGTAAGSIAWSTQDNVATTETGTLYDSKPINIQQHDQSAGITATLDSMGSTGPVLNYSAVLGSACYGILWCIQEQTVNSIIKRVPETVRFVESTPRRKTMWRLANETLQWAEGALARWGFVRFVNETLQWAETIRRQAGRVQAISETLQWVEVVIPNRKLRQVLIEVVDWYEVRIAPRGFARVVTETLQWVEATGFKKFLLKAINETISWVENSSGNRTMKRIVAEDVRWEDAARRVLGLSKVISETVTWSDAVLYFKNFTVIRSVIRLVGSFVTKIQSMRGKL